MNKIFDKIKNTLTYKQMMIILSLICVNWVIFTFKDDFTKSNHAKTTMNEGESRRIDC